jgi:hypothetical protein
MTYDAHPLAYMHQRGFPSPPCLGLVGTPGLVKDALKIRILVTRRACSSYRTGISCSSSQWGQCLPISCTGAGGGSYTHRAVRPRTPYSAAPHLHPKLRGLGARALVPCKRGSARDSAGELPRSTGTDGSLPNRSSGWSFLLGKGEEKLPVRSECSPQEGPETTDEGRRRWGGGPMLQCRSQGPLTVRATLKA